MAGIFKAYDIRGIVPTQLNEEIAYKIGLSFQHVAPENGGIVGGTGYRSRKRQENGEENDFRTTRQRCKLL